jgi:hypothetical protein
MAMTLGQFVKVGDSYGVVVGLSGTSFNVPKDHLAVWYGEINSDGKPKVKTLPEEYAAVSADVEYYH